MHVYSIFVLQNEKSKLTEVTIQHKFKQFKKLNFSRK